MLPAGFSAEHLGPNDFYYWDDFWAVAGLRSANRILGRHGQEVPALAARQEADRLSAAIDRSIERTRPARDRQGVPASPYRRMDSGAIGSIAAGYPLHLWSPRDPRLIETVDFLLGKCMVAGGFFQDMIHSGINAYLTLHVAQVLLRAGDTRYWRLIARVAELASPTGQWPEAIHPATGGGCMGDGQHVWAAAEWVLMIRNCFVREEDGRLVLTSGLPSSWLRQGVRLSLGPAPTPYGRVWVEAKHKGSGIEVRWDAQWRGNPAPIEVRLPGFAPRVVGPEQRAVTFSISSDRMETGYLQA